MYDTFARLGSIYDYHTLEQGVLLTIHQNELDTAAVRFNLTDNQQQFDSLSVTYQPVSTFSFFARLKNQRSSLSFWTPVGKIDINTKTMLSICSVYKITIILEYARQAG
jgi:beta-lactamase class A